MPDYNLISEEPLNMHQVKHELDKIKKRDEELNFRAKKTYEHLENFSKISFSASKNLYKSIEDLKIPRLKEDHIHKIIDILPTTQDDLKLVLSQFTVSVTQKNLKKICDVVKELVEQK